jgi:hypothetical protein
MRLDANAHDHVSVSLNETNLTNLIEFGKLVLMGGSPFFPETTVEIRLQSDDDHFAERIQQMDDMDTGHE